MVDAQFSVYFQCAVAWLHGGAGQDSFDLINDPCVLELMSNIDVSGEASLPDVGAELALSGDLSRPVRIEQPSGEPQNPIGWDGVAGKFRDLAEPVIGPEHVKRLIAYVRSRPAGLRVRQLLQLTVGV